MESSQIPQWLAGRWAVISAESPDGERFDGEILDYWEWSTSGISSADWQLVVQSVVAELEDHQDLHLITFTNHMQFAVLRSKKRSDDILVVEYADGREVMRCFLTRKA